MATLTLNFYNGLREPIEDARIFVSFIDGRGRVLRTEVKESSQLQVNLELSGDPIRDLFTVNASAKGYRDGGFIGLRFDEDEPEATLFLMLVHRKAEVTPLQLGAWPAEWAGMKSVGDQLIEFAEQSPLEGACWLNLLEAMRLLKLDITQFAGQKLVAGDKDTGKRRESGMLQDRAFLFVEPGLAKAMLGLQEDGIAETESSLLHSKPLPDENRESIKEVRFPEANVQFTVYRKKRDGDKKPAFCDIDMDYFKDKVSHGLLEVFPNTFFGTKTDPRRIYALRWMAGKNTQLDEFAPPYVLQP